MVTADAVRQPIDPETQPSHALERDVGRKRPDHRAGPRLI